jgi:HSP20 family protein
MSEILVEIEKQVSRLGREFQAALDRFQQERTSLDSYAVKVDVIEAENSVRYLIDLPGVPRENIQLSAKKGVLTVKGERQIPEPGHDEVLVRRERSYGQFYRSFPLPENASPKGISARMSNGVLEVTVPKSSPQGDDIVIT